MIILLGPDHSGKSTFAKNLQGYGYSLFHPDQYTEYEDYINDNIVDFKPKWPTTGIVGMHFATLHFDEVYLYANY